MFLRIVIPLVHVAVFCVFPSYLVSASPEECPATRAFELRMQGKADEAEALLEKAIAENPDNGLLYYELARTRLCMGLGAADLNVPDVKACIDKAVDCDPRDERFALFSGYMSFMNAYVSMQKNSTGVKDEVASLCETIELLQKIKPDRCEPALYLVEIYATLPEAMGGDRSKAEAWAEKLEAKDPIFGAKARALLLDDDEDRVEYWKAQLEKHKGNAEVLEELGRACLYEQRTEEGVGFLEQALETDPTKTILLLDVGRYHLLRVMHGCDDKDQALNEADKAFTKYLATEPVVPLKAYTYGLLSKVKYGKKDNQGRAELVEKAKSLDPFFSKASGVPNLALFVPPEKLYYKHRYLFLPF